MRNKSGFALLLALFIILFISLLFVALFNLLTTESQIAGNQEKDAKALYIAEAGIEDAVLHLRGDANWRTQPDVPLTDELPAGSGNNYSVTDPEDSVIITSVGTLSDGFSKTLGAKVSVSEDGPPHTVEIISWEEQ